MLRELFEWLLSRGTGPGRRLGLDREAVSIAARHRRQSEAWEPHLAATRQCLLDAAAACPQGGTALVLGSGACLDVPLSALAARFDTVVLADAHHPRPARRLARAFPNVRLMPVDLTGLAGPAGQVARHGGTLPRPLPIPDLSLGLRPDLTVSVNLASQLPIPLLRLLGSRLDETAQTDSAERSSRRISRPWPACRAGCAWCATRPGKGWRTAGSPPRPMPSTARPTPLRTGPGSGTSPPGPRNPSPSTGAIGSRLGSTTRPHSQGKQRQRQAASGGRDRPPGWPTCCLRTPRTKRKVRDCRGHRATEPPAGNHEWRRH